MDNSQCNIASDVKGVISHTCSVSILITEIQFMRQWSPAYYEGLRITGTYIGCAETLPPPCNNKLPSLVYSLRYSYYMSFVILITVAMVMPVTMP